MNFCPNIGKPGGGGEGEKRRGKGGVRRQEESQEGRDTGWRLIR
jgi:hypothetical protein